MDVSVFKKHNRFLMLALDHDASFRKVVSPHNPEAATHHDIIDLKKRIIAPLLSHVSGLLIDSEYGLSAYKQATEKAFIHHPPYLLRAEGSGYEGSDEDRQTKIVFSAAKLKENGAQGVKLLLYFNPFAHSVSNQINVARSTLEDARKEGMPLFIEIVTFNVPGFTTSRAALISTSLDALIKNGIVPDVWKLEFPEDEPNVCREMNQRVGHTPWILLTRGVSFDVFKDQLHIAVKAGAQGFLAGRALWQEVSDYEGKEKEDFLGETLPARFEELASIVLSGAVSLS